MQQFFFTKRKKIINTYLYQLFVYIFSDEVPKLEKELSKKSAIVPDLPIIYCLNYSYVQRALTPIEKHWFNSKLEPLPLESQFSLFWSNIQAQNVLVSTYLISFRNNFHYDTRNLSHLQMPWHGPTTKTTVTSSQSGICLPIQ